MILFSTGGSAQVEFGRYDFNAAAEASFAQPYCTFSMFTRVNVDGVGTADVFNSSNWTIQEARDDVEYVGFTLKLTGSYTFQDTLGLELKNSATGTGPSSAEVMYRYGSNAFASAGTWTPPGGLTTFTKTIPVPGNETEAFLESRFFGWSAGSTR